MSPEQENKLFENIGSIKSNTESNKDAMNDIKKLLGDTIKKVDCNSGKIKWATGVAYGAYVALGITLTILALIGKIQ